MQLFGNDVIFFVIACQGTFIATAPAHTTYLYVYSDTTQLDVELSRVELRRRVAIDTSTTQLNSTGRRVELSCVAINGPLVSDNCKQSITF